MNLKHRRWLVPEVVQTSATDCGPASLKSVLAGMGHDLDYRALREACQTDVDGSSIDTLEELSGIVTALAAARMIESRSGSKSLRTMNWASRIWPSSKCASGKLGLSESAFCAKESATGR